MDHPMQHHRTLHGDFFIVGVLQIKVNRSCRKSRKKIPGRLPSKNAYSKQDSLKNRRQPNDIMSITD